MPSDATLPPADDTDSQQRESEPIALKPFTGEALEMLEVDLRTPWIAAVCAWVFPGAGHFYQRRYVKGCIFMVCILATYFAGLIMSEGHAVYASWGPEEKRWQYFMQVGVGLPALPAIVQSRRARSEEFLEAVRQADDNDDGEVTGDELITLFERNDLNQQQDSRSLARYRPADLLARWDKNSNGVLEMDELADSKPWLNGWMAPPSNADQLADWHYKYGALFDMGTLYTLIAGLLNVLVVFDAQAGPLILSREEDYEKKKFIQTRMKFKKG